MTIRTIVTLTCDEPECDQIFRGSDGDSLKEVREQARKIWYWNVGLEHDFCTFHAMENAESTVLPEIVGFTLAFAVELLTAEKKFRIRITHIDGLARAVTRDVRSDRVNLKLENGLVTEAKIG